MSNDNTFRANNGTALMTSAVEAEIGAMFINARQEIPQCKTLIDMGHPQPHTPIQTDNSAAHSVVTNIVQTQYTKAMDMRFHWLRCRATQRQFRYYRIPGPNNLADYKTNHHAGSHHRNVRHEYLTQLAHLEAYRMPQKKILKDTQVSRTENSLAKPKLLARTQAILRDIRSHIKGVL